MPPGRRTRSRSLLIAVLTAFLAAYAFAFAKYQGSAAVFLVFGAATGLMLVLAIPRPRLYGYSFLALFLSLGFFAKVVAYWALGIALVEPIGAFDGSGPAWDGALFPPTVAAVALSIVRLGYLLFAVRREQQLDLAVAPPDWYVGARTWLIGATVAATLCLHVANLWAGFYQIGLQPRLILPAHLNVPVSWLLSNGLAMCIAMLVGWELALKKTRAGFTLLLPFVEALASVSILSRASYLLRAVGYLAVVADRSASFARILSRRWIVVFAVLVPVCFVLSIGLVSALRVLTYPPRVLPSSEPAVDPSAPAIELASGQLARGAAPMAREISTMLIGRWIGIEGTMAVSAYPSKGDGLLTAALVESPTSGASSLYQQLSGSPYQTSDDYIFLTTPGAIAVLYYAGSLWLVFVGMFMLATLLLAIEVAAARLVGNTFVVSIAMLALANGIAQMNFPYLFLVLCVEQAGALAAFGVIRIPWPSSRRVSTQHAARA